MAIYGQQKLLARDKQTFENNISIIIIELPSALEQVVSKVRMRKMALATHRRKEENNNALF